ncbi:MAG: NUDIX domain-containing protein [Patescibacteria group bacterium]|jgi:isopentenyl-diphosphate delta-isomerase type 1
MKTTDPQNEIFPVVNDKDEVIGKVTRQEAHRRPEIIHRVSAVLVFNARGEWLVQQRSLTKDKYPGCWELGMAGHVGFEDNYMNTAVRELKEELGLEIEPADLSRLGKIFMKFPTEAEFWDVYSCNIAEKQIVANKEEIIATRFISPDELKRMIQNPEIKWKPHAVRLYEEFLIDKPKP